MHFTAAVIVKRENEYADDIESVMAVLSPAFNYHYIDSFDVEEKYTVKEVLYRIEKFKSIVEAYAEAGTWKEGETNRQHMLQAFETALKGSEREDKVYIVNCHR